MKFDTLSWAKKLEKAGVPAQQAEVQVKLIFRAIDDNISTKQDFRDFEGNIKLEIKNVELKIEEVKKETMAIKHALELKIESVRSDLELKIENVKNDLELKIEGVKKDLIVAIEKVKGSINTQIAKWALGVSAVQTTILIYFIRSLH